MEEWYFKYLAGFRASVPTDLFLLCAHDYSTKIYGPLSFILSSMHNNSTKNWSSLIYLFYLYSTIRPKIRVLINLTFLFVHDHSTKNKGLHWFIYFICTQPFDQITWSSFIYSFFCAQPFDQKLGSTLMHFFVCTRPFDLKLGTSLI